MVQRPIPSKPHTITPVRQRLALSDALNLAGLLTVSRLPIAIAYPFLAADDRVALGLLLLAALTDLLDGVVARWTGTQSHTGAVLDGWIDKVLYVNIAWTLVLLHDVPAWWMLAWFSRELLQGFFVPVLVPAYYRGLPRARESTFGGKLTTWLVGLSLVASLLDLWWLAGVLTPMAGVIGLVSAARYLRRELSDIREMAWEDETSQSPALPHHAPSASLDGDFPAR